MADLRTRDVPGRGDARWRVEGRPSGGGGRRQRPLRSRWFWWLLGGALILNWAVLLLGSRSTPRPSVPYSVFHTQVEAGNVTRVTATGDAIQGLFAHAVAYAGRSGTSNKPKTTKRFKTRVPSFGGSSLTALLLRKGVKVEAKPPQGRPFWETLLFGFGPTLLFVALLFWLMRRTASAAAGGGIAGLGRIRARRYQPQREQRVTFADVAGIDEAEEELIEIVDFLRRPDRYRRLGGAIPRGVLLSGPPGTGKTLLARAVAGEASVPFFWLSASEFVEMVVGVGASRVRDLFEQARREAPAIVFVDELDAIGRRRNSSNAVGGHDEREQTLNQILTEMDGFTGREGVIVIGATNRVEILDPALLRPGRFDRRITVHPPDIAGRQAILEIHARGVPLDSEVDLGAIAAATPGMVGADLRNLVNEAALTAARRDHDAVTTSDLDDALERIVLGAERKLVITEEERRRTAYHEAGHALLGLLQPGADPVHTVSIVPRGRALGVTLQRPETDRYGHDTAYLRGRMIGSLGGRAAEQLVFDDFTTGAEADLEQVTGLARQMVGRWGMSEAVGPVSVLPRPDDDGPMQVAWRDGAAPRTLELVDQEVRRLVEECYEEAFAQLGRCRPTLDALARALLERETLDRHAIEQVTGISPHAEASRDGRGGRRVSRPNRSGTPSAEREPEGEAMQLNSLQDVLVEQLADLYSAEGQLLDALPTIADAAHSSELRQAFRDHLDETRAHVQRLEEAFGEISVEPPAETCEAMQGLIQEGEEIAAAGGDPAAIDAALIAAAQRVEHYEIAGYGTARTLAAELGYDRTRGLLDETLREEGKADKALTKLAIGDERAMAGINREASATG